MAEEYRFLLKKGEEEGKEDPKLLLDRIVADYISGMTDEYCSHQFMEYFVPKAWEKD